MQEKKVSLRLRNQFLLSVDKEINSVVNVNKGRTIRNNREGGGGGEKCLVHEFFFFNPTCL